MSAPDGKPAQPLPVVRGWGGAAWVLLVLVAITGLTQVAIHGDLFAARLTYPLDLEWLEGDTLIHGSAWPRAKGSTSSRPKNSCHFFTPRCIRLCWRSWARFSPLVMFLGAWCLWPPLLGHGSGVLVCLEWQPGARAERP